MGTIAYLFFKMQGKSIRSKREDELQGLDEPEMGMLAYPEFAKADVEEFVSFTGDDHRPKTPRSNGTEPDKVKPKITL